MRKFGVALEVLTLWFLGKILKVFQKNVNPRLQSSVSQLQIQKCQSTTKKKLNFPKSKNKVLK